MKHRLIAALLLLSTLILSMASCGSSGGKVTSAGVTTAPITSPAVTTPTVTTPPIPPTVTTGGMPPIVTTTQSTCEINGHKPVAATCTTPSFCLVCLEPLGTELAKHDFGEATCAAPATCKNCPATEGVALAHKYDSDTDRTCSVCKGERDVNTIYSETVDEPSIRLYSGNKSTSAPISLNKDGVYYARVYARGTDANHKLTLRLTDGSKTLAEYSYFVSTQLTEVCLPLTATGEEKFVEAATTGGGEFYVSTPSVIKSDYTYTKTKTGTYLVLSNEWQENTVASSDTAGLINDKTRVLDNVIIGDYMYALGGTQLHAFKRSGSTFVKIWESDTLGELRQMSLTSDGKGLVVVARNFGAYAFDLTDPEKPTVASHIDTLEMASGLDVFGKYLYVADRQFGVDIFDISDIYHPVFISNIPTGETQNVCYSNGYVYAGVWAECIVRVCDVRDVDNPKKVCDIKLSGRGDGVYVHDGILYAATGQHGPGESGVGHLGYGLGNGLELWDVSNPAKPTRLSVVRSDGANYPGNPDLWRVYTAGDYVIFSSVYCGLYIYDVSNKSAPVRIAHYQVLSETLTNTSRWTDKYIFPHQRGVSLDQNQRAYPVIDSYIDGDKIYICTGETKAGNNLYEATLPFSLGEPDTNDSDPKMQEDTYDRSYLTMDYEKMFGEGTMSYLTDSQIHGVAVKGEYLYLAAGSRGVIILNKRTLEECAAYPTFDITKDAQIYGKYLYTAEATAGIAIYEIDESDPTRLTLISQKAIANVVQLQLSPDARYALAHVSNTSALLDLRDKTNPAVYYSDTSFNMVYQYQMSIGCIDNRYLLMSASKKTLQVFDFGPDGSYEEPIISRWQDKQTSVSGLCADGKYAIISSGKNVYRVDLSDPNLSLEATIPSQYKSVKYTDMSQMPVVIGDYLFATLRRAGTYYILKLSADRSTATTHKSLVFHGNPGMIVSDGERYYLPLAYAGLVSFTLPEYIAKGQ